MTMEQKATVKRTWRKELRELIAEAMVTPLNDLAAKTPSEEAAENMITARNEIIRYVEKLLSISYTVPKKKRI